MQGTPKARRSRSSWAPRLLTPPAQPSHVEVIREGTPGYDHIATKERMIIGIGPMETGESVRAILFRVNRYEIVDVLHGGEPVENFEALPRFDPRLGLPRWAGLGTLFLLAGLARAGPRPVAPDGSQRSGLTNNPAGRGRPGDSWTSPQEGGQLLVDYGSKLRSFFLRSKASYVPVYLAK